MNSKTKKYTVYCHKNKINGKSYIGITSTSLYMRFRKNGRGYYPQVFGRAIQKYGWDSFDHIILMEGLTFDIASECEKYLIAKYQTNNPQYGYNITNGGEGNSSFRSEESNRKRSEALSGEKHWHYGQKWTPEVIAKLHKPHPSMAGENAPAKRPDVKAKLAESKREWHKQHPHFQTTLGYRHTDEAKRKISYANKGENNGNHGKKWYNNGEIEILTYEQPDGYVKGRLPRG